VPEGLTWRELIAEATGRVGATDARRIAERAGGFSAAELILALDERVTTRTIGFVDRMVARRETGEPLQYVLGEWSFRTLDLVVDRRVLIPRPETEVVCEVALTELDRLGAARPVVVDLGTGSGALALSIASERPKADVWATDASPDALAVARANLAGLGRAGQRVRVAEGSWFDALPGELRGAVDLIVSNPPYVAETDELPAEVADWEPRSALIPGPTGLEAIEIIVAGARAWLRHPGALVVELAPTQADAALALAQAAGFDEAVIRQDLAGRDRMLVARS
jgi:release factor glutamine methyltransferase